VGENMWEKYREEREKNESKGPKHGKQTNQKLKPYVVLQYLLKYSDENHTKSAYDIMGYLAECGIPAERRSIYRDIEDINRIMLMLQEELDLDEVDRMIMAAEESGDEEEVNDLKTILYDKNKKGFYVRQRKFEVADMRLLAECVYAAKFIAEGQVKRLVEVICEFVSEDQASKIRHNAFLTDRVKTDNKGVMNNIAAINEAMSRHIDGEPHTPEKDHCVQGRLHERLSKGDGNNCNGISQGVRIVDDSYALLLLSVENYRLLSVDPRELYFVSCYGFVFDNSRCDS